MPAKIRLKRVGRRGQPAYRVVVVDEDRSRNSAAIEELGYFNPIEDKFDINTAHALDWLKKGAQPTPTARKLLSKMGVMAQWHATQQGKDVPEAKEAGAASRANRPDKLNKKAKVRAEAAAEAAAAPPPAEEPAAEAEAAPDAAPEAEDPAETE
jgi:small subunit ribosomal protein S16